MRPDSYMIQARACCKCEFYYTLAREGILIALCLHGEELPERNVDLRRRGCMTDLDNLSFVEPNGTCLEWREESE